MLGRVSTSFCPRSRCTRTSLKDGERAADVTNATVRARKAEISAPRRLEALPTIHLCYYMIF
jgi:hypothetical protein